MKGVTERKNRTIRKGLDNKLSLVSFTSFRPIQHAHAKDVIKNYLFSCRYNWRLNNVFSTNQERLFGMAEL